MINQTGEHAPSADQVDATFAALSDPTRRAIVARLIEGEATVRELAEPFDMTLQAVSKHIKVLERAGLIARGRDRQFRPSRLQGEAFKQAADWLAMTRPFWAGPRDGGEWMTDIGIDEIAEREIELRLEVVRVPVSDVDRAKTFYTEGLGFTADHDTWVDEETRVVQLTPPGSACSIAIGTAITRMAPGSIDGLLLVVADMDTARSALLERGVDVGEVELLGRPGRPGFQHARLTDPDGNGWILQDLRPVG